MIIRYLAVVIVVVVSFWAIAWVLSLITTALAVIFGSFLAVL